MDRDYLLAPTGRPLHAIAAEVCAARRILPSDFFSRRRLKEFALARHEFCWRARRETTASYPEIARFLNYIDHTSVMHGVREHERRMSKIVPISDGYPQQAST